MWIIIVYIVCFFFVCIDVNVAYFSFILCFHAWLFKSNLCMFCCYFVFFCFFLWQKIFCNLDIFSLVFEFLSSGLLWVYYKNPLQKNTTPKFIMPSLPKIFWSKKTKKMTQYANLSCLNKFGFEQCMHVDLMDYKQQHWHSNPKIFLD